MMIGEIDYGSIIVEAKEQYNEETGAPLAPIPGFSAAILCLFCVMVSVLLMNLLVSVGIKFAVAASCRSRSVECLICCRIWFFALTLQ